MTAAQPDQLAGFRTALRTGRPWLRLVTAAFALATRREGGSPPAAGPGGLRPPGPDHPPQLAGE